MLVEDSLIDSAITVYDSIIDKYSLTGIEANDFAQGASLLNLLIAKRTGDRNLLSLSADQINTLHVVKANASMWAHVRAEGWLLMANGEAMTDTLLYPPNDMLMDTSGGGGGDGGRFSAPPEVTQTPATKNMVFPNPVHDMLQVLYTAKSSDDVTMQIEDISGRKLISQSLQSGMQTSVDMSFLTPGLYVYRIFEGSKVTMIGKVTKE